MSEHFNEIDSPAKLKQLKASELKAYSDWLRQFLIGKISETGGHFAANLGVIELSVALHYTLNTPNDILIWDVGHQAYAHKILTERKNNFDSLRQQNGISGFPKMEESPFDAFGTAHSSTSISAALGYAQAALLQNISRQHIAVIGDGAMSAGQAFEALNNAGLSHTNITVIINDNHIGIDPSQGALGEYLERLENRKDNLFTDFGFQYYGPVDGHDLDQLIPLLESIQLVNKPKIVHIRTLKGKGYAPAEAEQTKWHSTSKFDKLSGKNAVETDIFVKYQDIFGKTLLEIAESNDKVVAVTPAMISGSSLHFMQEKFPERVFDVGIAEQHAITFSAGLAAAGLTPVCCIYSTFLQRGYDQLIHDVALQNLPVIFAVDRAGLVGEDGPTHHGVFDIPFLQAIPNISIISPSNQEDLRNALYSAVTNPVGPVVIRYPRGKAKEEFKATKLTNIALNRGKLVVDNGHKIAIISVGTILEECITAIEDTAVSVFDAFSVKPLDKSMIEEIFNSFPAIIIVEESQILGGFGSSVLEFARELNYKGTIRTLGIPDVFVGHASIREQRHLMGIDARSIRQTIDDILLSIN
ncbi:MAG: 1-deoxy-D-xylulose-5-phosphate synthase [Chitinophagaceae bacterium]